jgi:threonine dehydrogenase-like Zn-dependent dehydrogenase
MRAVLLDPEVAVRDIQRPAAADAALVRVELAGVCGTDLKIASGAIPVTTPRVLGHEIVGRVVSSGALVPAGTRVLVDPAVSCGRCRPCSTGMTNLCANGGLLGRDSDGGFAEYIAIPESSLHPIPDAMPDEDAALLQVLSTCVHAQAGLPPTSSATVVGLGVTGLLHVQLLRRAGVPDIVGVTRSAWKRELALRLGATRACAPDDAPSVAGGSDLVIECAGTPESFERSIELAGPGATVVAFGASAAPAVARPYAWYLKELTIRSPRAALSADCDTAISAVGDIETEPLVTGWFPLDEARAAFDACRDPAHLKVVLQVG